jgi:hypothetical protein
VIEIDAGAFNPYRNGNAEFLVEGVYIPDSMVKIDENAFRGNIIKEFFYKGQTYNNSIVITYILKDVETIQFGDYDWMVLDKKDDKALIISLELLEQRAYHSKDDIIDATQGYNTTWEEGGIRWYLNNDFYNRFSDDDKARILETQVINNNNPEYGTPGGNDTTDFVFLLSIDEAKLYFSDDNSRIAYVKKGWYLPRSWWLRSPGQSASSAAFVLSDGKVPVFSSLVIEPSCVRPAMWLAL